MIKLHIESYTVGGTRKGGVDINLVGRSSLPPNLLTDPDADPKEIVKNGKMKVKLNLDDPSNVEYVAPDKKGQKTFPSDSQTVLTFECYDIEWSGTVEEIVKVLDVRNPKAWRVIGDLDGNFSIKFENEVFLDGNAD